MYLYSRSCHVSNAQRRSSRRLTMRSCATRSCSAKGATKPRPKASPTRATQRMWRSSGFQKRIGKRGFSSILFDSLRVFRDFHGFSPCVVLWSWCQGPSKCLEPPRGDDVRGHARTVTYAESSEVAYVSSIIIIICLLILIVITTYVT